MAAGFAVGIGLTNECDLRCPHCYRPALAAGRLSRQDVARVFDSIPARSVNLGVGENGLHPDYRAILDDLHARRLPVSITSNGLSIQSLPDATVKRFHAVECSLDFPTEREHDGFRGRGNWRLVMDTLARASALGVPVTVTAVLMRINHRRLPEIARVAAPFGAPLRVNIYQPSRGDQFSVGYGEFWDAMRRLADATRLVATTEPVLAGVLGIDEGAPRGCGRSTVRVAPDGRVLPCTYWPDSTLRLADLEALGESITDTAEFRAARQVPPACAGCPCRGGCAGRRALVGGLEAADPFCPFARGERIALRWEREPREELPKLGSACTTVVSAR
ncbi:MAG: radical SAM protein [Candidatus Rokubacteria bacterium]|nr:radical SAM protein [Candidatus Rokubacteria bacterium]